MVIIKSYDGMEGQKLSGHWWTLRGLEVVSSLACLHNGHRQGARRWGGQGLKPQPQDVQSGTSAPVCLLLWK